MNNQCKKYEEMQKLEEHDNETYTQTPEGYFVYSNERNKQIVDTYA